MKMGPGAHMCTDDAQMIDNEIGFIAKQVLPYPHPQNNSEGCTNNGTDALTINVEDMFVIASTGPNTGKMNSKVRAFVLIAEEKLVAFQLHWKLLIH